MLIGTIDADIKSFDDESMHAILITPADQYGQLTLKIKAKQATDWTLGMRADQILCAM